MQEQIQPVILCGGARTRLWPASRGERAKQFLDIVDDASLFASTLARVSDRHFADPLVDCGPGMSRPRASKRVTGRYACSSSPRRATPPRWLGSWHAVHNLTMRDEAGNAVNVDAFLHDSRGCLVRAGGRRVSLIDMKDVAVVVDGDDILVMPLARSQDVRAAAQARA